MGMAQIEVLYPNNSERGVVVVMGVWINLL